MSGSETRDESIDLKFSTDQLILSLVIGAVILCITIYRMLQL